MLEIKNAQGVSKELADVSESIIRKQLYNLGTLN